MPSGFTNNNLIRDLEAKQEEHEELLQLIQDLFKETDLEYKEDNNYYSWEFSLDDLHALFTLNNSDFSFKCYVDESTENNKINYSQEGISENAYDAAVLFLENLNDLLGDKE